MTSLTIQGRDPHSSRFAFLDDGFRPFFLGAGLFAVITIAVWTVVYAGKLAINLQGVSIFHWHAHELVYGYTMAVVAGFMLTAIEKWTGIPRIRGAALAGLVVMWAVPRVLLLFGSQFIVAAGVIDLLFVALLAIVIARQWKQLGGLTKLVVLAAGQACFYLGALGLWADGTRVGVYAGLYMLVGLILMIARRVVPQFIQRGVDRPIKLRNSRLLDRSALGLFAVFFVAVLWPLNARLTGGLAAILFFIHAIRLIGWYTNGIWTKPLLWSLYFSIVWIDVGFLIYALSAFGYVSTFIAVHAFAYGGIGMATLSMMSRVTLGHTGRNIRQPPRVAALAMICLAVGAVVRVFLPWAIPTSYATWIGVSQGLWLSGFSLFLIAYVPILCLPPRHA